MKEGKKKGFPRRSFFKLAGGASLLAIGGQAYFLIRSFIPNVLYEPLKRIKIGFPKAFPQGHKFLSKFRMFVFKDDEGMRTVSCVCTHLGCNVQISEFGQPRKVKHGDTEVEETFEFVCPCHGSKFRADGTNYVGPAPTPLPHYRMEIAPDDGQLVVDKGVEVDQKKRLKVEV
jgi:nitrite reductase/ring-hydroxylating ferredoxin subunit